MIVFGCLYMAALGDEFYNMRKEMMRQISNRLSAVLMGMLLIFSVSSGRQVAASDSPFDTLLGSWGGSGIIALQDGKKERINCTAYYTGGGAQLGLAIYCKSSTQDVKMRGKLSYNAGQLSGSWEEVNFNATGQISGKASSNRLSMRIGGNVSGTMIVSYSKTKQSVTISTEGIGLKSVKVNLSRR